MPASTMAILRQCQATKEPKVSFNKTTTRSDSSEHPVAQTHAWAVENRDIGERIVQSLINNPRTEKTNVEGNKILSKFVEQSGEPYEAIENLNDRKFEIEVNSQYISVKGKLKQHYDYWQNTIKANEAILNIIQEGYKLPFVETPSEAIFRNNNSAIVDSEFVQKSIEELLLAGSISECKTPPKVVNPLSVAINSHGKKRLILDLRYVNNHLYKDKIKFDDWKCFENYLKASEGYLFKFDLKNGYHHVDIYHSHQTYLGFSWEFNGITKYFVFTVLPFGLTSAPFVFTKIVRPLVKYWRGHAVKIACFLDDGLGIGYQYNEALRCSKFVKSSLINSGFVPNDTKSIWIPCQNIIWLGIEIDINNNMLKITSHRITSILNKIERLTNKIYISARELSQLAGKIVSTKFIIGNIIHLKTRNIFKTIEERSSWDSKFNLSVQPETIKEIVFWKNNIKNLNKKFIREYKTPSFVVYSDASDSGLASIYKEKGKDYVCYKNFSDKEKSLSSTWRELEAIRYSLNCSKEKFKNKIIFWYTDNYACSLIVRKGSTKSHLHNLALEIHNLTFKYSIDLNVCWVPREENTEADLLSKQIDYDDWYITSELVSMLTRKWGKVTIDRFASHTNRKVDRFNSKYICPGTEGVNAFSVDWSHENNLLVPPVYLIPKTITHFLASKFSSKAILLCPYWPSSTFWPMLFKSEGIFQDFIEDVITIDDPIKYVKLGNNKASLIGSEAFTGSFIALKLVK